MSNDKAKQYKAGVPYSSSTLYFLFCSVFLTYLSIYFLDGEDPKFGTHFTFLVYLFLEIPILTFGFILGLIFSAFSAKKIFPIHADQFTHDLIISYKLGVISAIISNFTLNFLMKHFFTNIVQLLDPFLFTFLVGLLSITVVFWFLMIINITKKSWWHAP